MDLLLQLLTNMIYLPVGKSHVKKSGMGKLIGSIEKHAMVKGTPNEAAVLDRVQKVKDAWQASVKARRAKDAEATKKSEEAAKVAAAGHYPQEKWGSCFQEAGSKQYQQSNKRQTHENGGCWQEFVSLVVVGSRFWHE